MTGLVLNPDKSLLFENPLLYEAMFPDPDNLGGRFVNGILTRFGVGRHNGVATRVLDVGCGVGREVAYLHGLGYDATGLDPEAAMLDLARQQCPGARFVVGRMPAFDLGETFDAVTSLGSAFLYNYTNEEVAGSLATFARHLTTGGLLLLEMRNAAFFLIRTGWERWLDAEHVTEFEGSGGTIRGVGRWWIELETQLLRRTRTWTVPDRPEPFEQHSAFRLLFPQELRQYLTLAGFTVEAMFDAPGCQTLPEDEWTSDDLPLSPNVAKQRLHVVARRL